MLGTCSFRISILELSNCTRAEPIDWRLIRDSLDTSIVRPQVRLRPSALLFALAHDGFNGCQESST